MTAPPELLIVGAGPAGATTAIQAQRMGLSVRLLDAQGRAGGLTHQAYRIDNLPGLVEPCPGPEFARRLQAQLDRLNIAVEPVRVRHLDPAPEGGFRVDTSVGVVWTRRVALALGTVPRRLGVSGESRAVAAGCLGYEAEVAERRSAREVVVVGGGEAAHATALRLASGGTHVTLLTRHQGGLVRGALAAAVARSSRIMVKPGYTVTSVAMEFGGVTLRVAGPKGADNFHAEVGIVCVGRISALDRVAPGLGGQENLPIEPWPNLFLPGDVHRGQLGQIGMAAGDGLWVAKTVAERIKADVRRHVIRPLFPLPPKAERKGGASLEPASDTETPPASTKEGRP